MKLVKLILIVMMMNLFCFASIAIDLEKCAKGCKQDFKCRTTCLCKHQIKTKEPILKSLCAREGKTSDKDCLKVCEDNRNRQEESLNLNPCNLSEDTVQKTDEANSGGQGGEKTGTE